MKELYGIDMEKKQYSKLISSIPEPDISISMGCDVGCPFIGRAFDDNWKLEDPTGKTDDDFRGVIQQIEKNILELKKKWLQYKFQFVGMTWKMKFKEQSFTLFAYTNYRTIQGSHRLEPLDFKGKGAFHHSLVQ